MRIVTSAVFPPIPSRSMDWSAVDDDTYDGSGPIGWGATKREAISDLLDQMENAMNDVEFRAVLDWWMCSDPWSEAVPKQVIDDWLERESQARGYQNLLDAYHYHMKR